MFKQEKKFIIIFDKTGGNQDFVRMEFIRVTNHKFVLVVEAKGSVLHRHRDILYYPGIIKRISTLKIYV